MPSQCIFGCNSFSFQLVSHSFFKGGNISGLQKFNPGPVSTLCIVTPNFLFFFPVSSLFFPVRFYFSSFVFFPLLFCGLFLISFFSSLSCLFFSFLFLFLCHDYIHVQCFFLMFQVRFSSSVKQLLKLYRKEGEDVQR